MHKLIDSEPYELSKEAADFVDKLNGEWDAVQTRRERHEAEAKRIATIDPLEFTAKDAAAKRRHRDEGIAILQATVPLLKRLAEWTAIRQKERQAELERTAHRQEEAAAEIRTKLRDLGFDPLTYAIAAASDPTEQQQFERQAEGAIELLSMYHPTVAPLHKHGRTMSRLARDTYDLKRDDIDKQIESAQAALRSLIAATT